MSTPIGPQLPSPREILNNRTQDLTGQPTHPIDFEEVRDYLITQKSVQKKNHDKRHNARDLPELHPGQPFVFLSPADVNSNIEYTITGPYTTSHNYRIEVQGKTYCYNRYHICTIYRQNTHSRTICASR